MGMAKDLPVFLLEIDEAGDSDLEVNYVAMVDKPAIESNWTAFTEAIPLGFAVTNEDEQILIGAAMIPDKLIYRNEPGIGEFFVKFDRPTIEKIALKFFENGYQKNVNLMHSADHQLPGVTFFQSFIQDKAKGVPGMPGDYPDGTWFLGAKVNNPQAWQLVKDGKVKGWSVEGMFKYKRKQQTKAEIFDQIGSLLENIL
jgi:hypothetical protein